MSQPLGTTLPPPSEGRSWRNMANVVERLAFMTPFNVDTRMLRVLLTLGEAGGELTFERLGVMSGVPTALVLRSLLRDLENPGVNAEGSITVSADGNTVTLTASGLEACRVWNLPLKPLNPALSPEEPDSVLERDAEGLLTFP